MTTITRENAEIKSFITGFLSDPAHDNQSSNSLLANVFRIALASLEAEPVAYQYRLWDTEYDEWGEWEDCGECAFEGFVEEEKCLGAGVQTRKLYTAPPAPVAPEADPVAWTDEEELRDVKQYGLGEIFQYPPDKYADSCRVIPLYRVPPASMVQAQGIEIAINELVALSPRLDKQAVETLSMAVAQLRKLVKKQLQAKE